MNLPTLPLCKQNGFSLLESLIALAIFSIIVLGSSVAVSRMLSMQNEMNVDFVLINMMQTKLQNSLNSSSANGVCNSIDLNSFIFAGKRYYMACAYEEINIENTKVKWPVLAVSDQQNQAQSCANGTPNATCYVVGR